MSYSVSLVSATEVTPEIEEQIKDLFEYHTLDEDQIRRGSNVRMSLTAAVRMIIENVPPSADRSTAIRKLREARMDCLSAITHRGRY